jgi:hypothetical protein
MSYATSFHLDISFHLMERRYVTLQQMFNDAQEVEYNLQACEKLQNQILEEVSNVEEQENEHDQQIVDLHIDPFHDKQETYCFMNLLEECHENEHTQERVVLNFYPFHYEQRVDYAMNFFEICSDGCHETKSADQLVEEQVVFPIFLMDDIAGVHDFPKYHEYDDDMMLIS